MHQLGVCTRKYRIAEHFRGRKVSRFGTKREFCGENFRGLLRNVQLLRGCGHKILRRKLSRIAPVRPIITWVLPQNFAEKTFADCSGTSNYYVGVATKFCGENFHGWF